LDPEQHAAFDRCVRTGNGYAGGHAADTEYAWEWYGGLVGSLLQEPP
jgi:hypothetical protein